MARLNHEFLGHSGTTDVLSFDYATAETMLITDRWQDRPSAGRTNRQARRRAVDGPDADHVNGEVIISVGEALRQARVFRTTWQAELVRYLIHGVLHLQGYDDQTPALRTRMKRVENRLLKEISAEFNLKKLAGEPRMQKKPAA
jgi:rRNA maturation RNase YbeY